MNSVIYLFMPVESKTLLETATDVGTFFALVTGVITLWYSIYQSKLSQKSLDLAEKSIKIADTNRQLELLPSHEWIIQVDVHLNHWQGDLKKQMDIMEKIKQEHNYNLIKLLNLRFASPKDLKLDSFLYNKMPQWLCTLWISGAQYYFDAMAPLSSTFNCLKGENIEDHALTSLLARFKDSYIAILELRNLLDNMIPKVILNTPASVNERDFLNETR